jgi:adenosylhomocysteine nucleosidase
MADAGGAVAPPPVPADVGVVAALPIEVAPLLRRLRNARKYSNQRQSIVEGECAGKLVALAVTGPGRKAAARGARLLLTGHRPRWMISAGFGGALVPALERFDVVFANEVLDLDKAHFTIDVGIPTDEETTRVFAGRLLTVDRIIRTAAEKADLRRTYQADIVDMETSAVAAYCAERGVRFMAIRVVSDTAAEDLPREVQTILGRTGGYRVGAALGAVWRRPSSVKDLLSLRERAVASARRLADVMIGVIGQLP